MEIGRYNVIGYIIFYFYWLRVGITQQAIITKLIDLKFVTMS